MLDLFHPVLPRTLGFADTGLPAEAMYLALIAPKAVETPGRPNDSECGSGAHGKPMPWEQGDADRPRGHH